MSNQESEIFIESEVPVPAPGELASKILQLRAKGDAKNNPKKPKAPTASRPTRIIAPDSKADAAIEKAGETEVKIESVLEIAPSVHKKSAESHPQDAAPSDEKLESLAARIENLSELISAAQEQIGQQNSARDKAFDALYEEMSDYKNDFFYERLKPTLRALLFLLDSIEEFEREVETRKQSGVAIPGEVLQSNLAHFRDQLVDVFAMSEMAPIEAPDEKFDAKTQRAVQVVRVEAAQNNLVQKQVRGGWTLGGKTLRVADVIVGKSDEK